MVCQHNSKYTVKWYVVESIQSTVELDDQVWVWAVPIQCTKDTSTKGDICSLINRYFCTTQTTVVCGSPQVVYCHLLYELSLQKLNWFGRVLWFKLHQLGMSTLLGFVFVAHVNFTLMHYKCCHHKCCVGTTHKGNIIQYMRV